MLGHYPSVDKSQLVSYVEDYLECVESLPLDIQRNVSLLREIDTKYQEILKEVDEVFEKYKKEADGAQRKRLQVQLQRALISSQELGDEKIHVVTQMMEVVENRSRQMEAHSPCFLDPAEAERSAEKPRQETAGGAAAANAPAERAPSRRPRRHRNSESRDSCYGANGANGALDDAADEPPPPPPPAAQQPREKKSKSAKKKKRSKKQERDVSPAVEFNVDPNEPTYCLCEQVSYGEMIGCDNEQCPIEWFHFSCVGLTYKPKGKWYCPKCRGDSEKTMDKSTERPKKDRRSR
ncbi:inhibitor of growth protein 2 isoform X2 [Trichomycterus rosablanca]|uniref:inhibitor of growth protein 2 isoform X2 n=1 Tax=Trichomycterus rosablanca TaxID=2290929 RepID=UPI002F35B95F